MEGSHSQYQWKATPGAAYYLVVVFNAQTSYYLYTQSNSVQLDDKDAIRILAFDRKMNIIDRPIPTKTPQVVVSPEEHRYQYRWKETAGVTYYFLVAYNEKSSFYLYTRSNVVHLTGENSVHVLAFDAMKNIIDRPIVIRERDSKADASAVVLGPVPEQKKAEKGGDRSFLTYDDLAIGLCAGSETITARAVQGGTASFNGSTKFAGVDLSLRFGVSNDPDEDLVLAAVAARFRYYTFLAFQTISGANQNGLINKIQADRSSGSLALEHRLWHYDEFSLSSFVGMGLYDSPLLTPTISPNVPVKLHSYWFFSPLVGFRVGQKLGQDFGLGIRVEALPIVLEKGKTGTRTMAELEGSYFFSSKVFSALTLAYTTENVQQRLSCSAGVSPCNNNATSVIPNTSINFGFGIRL